MRKNIQDINLIISGIALFILGIFLPNIWKYIDLTAALFIALAGITNLLWGFFNLENSKISKYANAAIGLILLVTGLTIISDDFLFSTVFITPGMFFFLINYIQLLKKQFPKDIDLGFKGFVWAVAVFALAIPIIILISYGASYNQKIIPDKEKSNLPEQTTNSNIKNLYYNILVDSGYTYVDDDYGFQIKYPNSIFYFDEGHPRGNELSRECFDSIKHRNYQFKSLDTRNWYNYNIEILIYENEYKNEEDFLTQEVRNNKFISSVLSIDNTESVESRIIDFAGKKWIESWSYPDDYFGAFGATELRTMHQQYIYAISYSGFGAFNMTQDPEDSITKQGLEIFKQMLNTFEFVDDLDISKWQTYQNTEYGFEFKHPNYWYVEEYISADIASLVIKIRKDALGFLFEGDTRGPFKAVIKFYILSNPEQYTSKEWVERQIEKGEKSGYQIFQHGSRYDTFVGKYPAYEIYGVAPLGYENKYEDIYLAYNKLIFNFSFPIAEKNPSVYNPISNNKIAHKILSTFKITK